LTASIFTASAATVFNFSGNVSGDGGFTSTLSGTVTIDTVTGTVDQWNITSPDFAPWIGAPSLTIDIQFTTLAGNNSALETLQVSFFPPFNFVGFTGTVVGDGVILGLVFSQHCSSACSVREATISPSITPSAVPLPAALPLFVTGLGALGLIGWRRKRKQSLASRAFF
jgi:hypothetical protein